MIAVAILGLVGTLVGAGAKISAAKKQGDAVEDQLRENRYGLYLQQSENRLAAYMNLKQKDAQLVQLVVIGGIAIFIIIIIAKLWRSN